MNSSERGSRRRVRRRTVNAVTPPTRIAIDNPQHPTSLVVERGALARLGEVLAREAVVVRGRKVLVAFDANVAATHAASVTRGLREAGAVVTAVELRASEAEKSMHAVERVWGAALEARLDRGSLVVAVGGGLVGDLAGFAAATYLRGIDLVQVPTTLLAMVDASIGGKTGVNLELPGGGLGKNLAGAFWQPRVTVADANALATLPARELRAGLAECVKHAIIDGAAAFEALERDAPLLRDGDAAAIDALIPRSASVKAGIVSRDPFERGERAKLNLGHTFGHAIETLPQLDLLHGEAVAIGLVAAARCAEASGGGSVGAGGGTGGDSGRALALRIAALLEALGLPTRLSAPVSATEVVRRMGFDKKNEGSALKLVLPRALGDVVVTSEVPTSAIEHALAAIGAS